MLECYQQKCEKPRGSGTRGFSHWSGQATVTELDAAEVVVETDP